MFLWLQENALFSMGALLHNPTPGIDFTGADLVSGTVKCKPEQRVLLQPLGSPDIACELGKEQPGDRCFNLNITFTLGSTIWIRNEIFLTQGWKQYFSQLICCPTRMFFQVSLWLHEKYCSVRAPCSPTRPQASALLGPIL